MRADDPDGEYFWPDSGGRPGSADVPLLTERTVVFTSQQPPSPAYGSFVVDSVKLDIRQLPAQRVIGIALPAERQDVDLIAAHRYDIDPAEVRKYGLGAVLVTQQPGSIPAELLSQGDNFFVFHLLSAGDLAALKRANAHFSYDRLANGSLRPRRRKRSSATASTGPARSSSPRCSRPRPGGLWLAHRVTPPPRPPRISSQTWIHLTETVKFAEQLTPPEDYSE